MPRESWRGPSPKGTPGVTAPQRFGGSSMKCGKVDLVGGRPLLADMRSHYP